MAQDDGQHRIRLREQLLRQLRECLLQSHFKRRSNSFFRDTADLTQVISIQTSRDYLPGAFKFTVNVGVFSKELARGLGGFRSVAPASADMCHIRGRIGNFAGRRDTWWLTTDELETNSAAADVCQLLCATIVPFLDANSTTADFLVALGASDKLSADSTREAKDWIMFLTNGKYPEA